MDNDEVLTISQISSFYSDDAYQSFINSIRNYPIATSESNNEYFFKYKETGKKEYFDLLVTSNIRYVISIASHYAKFLNHLEFLDVIQNGILGLIESIKHFDPEKGAFSTNATIWIKRSILQKIDQTEELIRKPSYMNQLSRKYSKLIKEGETYSDDEICSLLEISSKTLDLLRKSFETRMTTSIDEQLGEDDKREVGFFIPDKHDDYFKAISEYDNNNLKIVLKEVLSSVQFYVIYYRYLFEEKKSLEEIAVSLHLTRERVRQIEVNALKKIKPYLEEKRYSFRNALARIREREGNRFNYLSTKALSPNSIITYWYIKDSLTLEEKQLYEELVFGKYQAKPSVLAQVLKKNLKEVNSLLSSIESKRKSILVNNKDYVLFKNRMLENYGTEIFRINEEEKNIIDYQELDEKYANLSYQDIMTLFEEVNYPLSENEKRLLERFFGNLPKVITTASEIEREINVLKYGYRRKNTHVPLNKLYREYLRIKDDFTEDQQLYLECFFFGKKDHKEFLLKYPNYIREHEYHRVITRLERSYYHIFDYFDRSFTKNEWEIVRSKYMDRFSPFKLKLLDMEYGIDGKKYSREEMSNYFGIDKDKLSHDLRAIIRYANSLYIGLSNRIDIDKNIYIPYILNKRYEFVPETRNILHLFMIENKTYEEMEKITGLSKNRISNIITAGVRRIDFYRFGIISSTLIQKNDLLQFYQYKQMTDMEKKVVHLKYFEYLDNMLIAEKLQISLKEVSLIVGKFNDLFYAFKIKDVTLEPSDLIYQAAVHISESVLNSKERKIISLLYGIKNIYNPTGVKLTKQEVLKEFNIRDYSLRNTLQKIKDYVKGYKIGIKKPEDLFIERNKMDKLLDDIHLPISDKEREVICYLFELKGFPYKSMDDLALLYQENKSSVRVRYNRALVSIFKYLNNEMDGKLSFDVDIVPLLKYFGISDRNKIIDFYRDNMSYEAMSRKYQLPLSRISVAIQRINANIYELMHNSYAKRFDFDYYLEAIQNPDLPFYGDLEIAKKIFNLCFGMENATQRMSAAEAARYLDLDIDASTANRIIANLMLATCKLKDGITKEKQFSNEEVMAYYNERSSDIPEWHWAFYERFMKKRSNSSRLNETQSNLSYIVINDLIKEKYPDAFVFDSATREEVLVILNRYGNKLMRRVRTSLMSRFNIQEREFMNGREINHIYKLLNKLNKLHKMTKQKIMKI